MSPPPDRPGDAPTSPPPDRPDAGGERPETGAAPDAQTQTEQVNAQTAFVPTRETWLLLGLWTLVLAGGLVLVIRFKP